MSGFLLLDVCIKRVSNMHSVRCVICIPHSYHPCLLGSTSAAVAAGNPEYDSSNSVPVEARLFKDPCGYYGHFPI